MKLLFQQISVMLEEQNDIAYLPSIHYDWEKDVITTVPQHLIFLNCQMSTLLDFHKRLRLTRYSAVER